GVVISSETRFLRSPNASRVAIRHSACCQIARHRESLENPFGSNMAGSADRPGLGSSSCLPVRVDFFDAPLAKGI
ncbi:hypothetical protein, partial [Pseudomonas aeruginosa]|uniref:hypothetical protein n=1 Tax=Pseudomonas aeruginosa TaxID=287 RepID=UPI001CD2EA23